MNSREASRRFYTDVGVVLYTLSQKGFFKARQIYRFIHKHFDINESYVVFYGYSKPKSTLPLSTYFLEPPYNRGKIFVVGAKLVQNPVVLFLNLDSNCLKEDEIVDSVENIINGKSQLYFTSPFIDKEFLEAYKNLVYGILEKVGLGNILYPSYSVVVGRRKFFLTADHTAWSIEPLIAVGIPREFIEVKNDGCIDSIPKEFAGFGNILMDILAKKLISKLNLKK
jgi:hypothetical protein